MKSPFLAIALLFPLLFGGHEPLYCMGDPDEVIVLSSDVSRKGWLGVSVQDMTPGLAKSMGVSAKEGALVNEVIDDSPADSAGVKDEDVIIEFNGKTIGDADDLVHEVRKLDPGTKASVVLMRDNDRKTLQVAVGRTPRHPRVQAFAPMPPLKPRMRMMFHHNALGMELQDLNEQMGEYFGAPDREGVLITEVEKGSAGDKAGLKAGDVITKAGNQRVREIDDIWDEVEEYEDGQTVDFEILRRGSRQTIKVEIEDVERNYWFFGPRSKLHFGPECRCDVKDLGRLEHELQMKLDHSGPELDQLRIELEQLGTEIREWGRQFRDKIEAEIRSVVS